MSLFVFAGSAQFAAIGYVVNGYPWIVIVALTALINARHLLYGTVMAPYLAHVPRGVKAVMAYQLNDETFAIALSHFRRIGRADLVGYAIAAIGGTGAPWIVGSIVGAAVASGVPDPTRFGLDVVFPAAMGGLAVGLLARRRDVVAAGSGAVLAVLVALFVNPAVGVVVGGLVGPIVAMVAIRDEDDVAIGSRDAGEVAA
jgi:predicted branched-subunit amino acid permease